MPCRSFCPAGCCCGWSTVPLKPNLSLHFFPALWLGSTVPVTALRYSQPASSRRASSGLCLWMGRRALTAAKRIPCAAPPTTARSAQCRSTRPTAWFRFTTPSSADNYESIVSLEIALQQVFDHAKSQLPEEVKKRVIQHWQFCGHGDNLNAGRPAVAGGPWRPCSLLQGHTRDPPARADVGQRDQACPSLVRHGAPPTVHCRQRTVYDNLCFLHKLIILQPNGVFLIPHLYWYLSCIPIPLFNPVVFSFGG